MKLRIVSGIYGGRYISAPDTMETRPTTEKNRAAIFNILFNRIDFDGIRGVDLYAGSGALGFEMLSRGAASVHFVEKSAKVLRGIEQNGKSLGLGSEMILHPASCLGFVNVSQPGTFDLILADPPFFAYDIYEVFSAVKERKLLTAGGIFLVERSVQTKEKDIAAFGMEPYKRMGDSLVYIYEEENTAE